ncbi:hypothetical protein GIB67_032874 [Kingdonia uniflora]|uniref:Uncharacterized protein n=1 Tax=Kingdonia uniflora TaxID=39325 RepID=A0A7J7NBV4_9MAGN|nr:hypothetical protein GIB67_032874 [Kingdonia uniflora]
MLLHLSHSPTLIVSSHNIACEIMKTQDTGFANRPRLSAAKDFLYGCRDMIFVPYSDYYRQMWKICVQELLSITWVRSFSYVSEEVVTLMIEKISCLGSLQTPVNILEVNLTFSNHLTYRCAFSTKGDDGNTKFGEFSREVSIPFRVFDFGDIFPSIWLMDTVTGMHRRMKNVSQEIDAFFEQVIEEHIYKCKVGAKKGLSRCPPPGSK